MTPAILGTIFAFVALLSWGLGDFCIQKTARKLGSWQALFAITAFGSVVLFPFVSRTVGDVLSRTEALLFFSVLGLVILFASLFDFEALRQGKLAIVEPLIGLELPITIGLSIALRAERVSTPQAIAMTAIVIGVVLAVTRDVGRLRVHRRVLERGAILAGIGAVGMALANYLVGVGSQDIDPLLTIWIGNTVVAVLCAIVITYQRAWSAFVVGVQTQRRIVLGEASFDTVAWVSYALATAYIPISLATAMSESYIAFAVLLGVVVNRERVQRHQLIGSLIAIMGVVALGALTTSS